MKKKSFRHCAVVVAAAFLLAGVAPEALAGKKKPRLGVFGTIHGKKFKATNLLGVGDDCVNGRYLPASGILILTALECRPTRRRQGAQKRNFKILVLSCINPNSSSNPLTPPYEIPCGGSVYEENETGRFGQSVAKSQWISDATFVEGGILTSNLHIRVDAIDGANLRGTFFGSFDMPLTNATGTAAIKGEAQFNFPFVIQ